MPLGVRIANRYAVGVEAFGRGVVETGLQTRSIVDVRQRDIGGDRHGGKADAVRACPAELIDTEVVRVALVGQLVGLQRGQRNLLTRGHVHAVQLQCALGRQAGDADRLQGLAFRVDEPRSKQRVTQHDGRVLLSDDTHIGDHRCGVVESLHPDLVGVVAAIAHPVAVAVERGPVAGVSHGKAAVCQAGDRRLELGRVDVAVDQRLAINALPRGVVLLNEDTVRAVVADSIARPGHGPASVVEADDVGIELRVARGCIHAELGTDLVADVVEALRVDARIRQVLPRGVPHNNESTVLQGRHRRHFLRTGGVGIDVERRPLSHTRCVEALPDYAGAVAVSAVVTPHHDEATAIGQPGDARLLLIDGSLPGRIGPGFTTLRGAVRQEALEKDIAELGEISVVVIVEPRHHEAICRRRQGRLVLSLRRRGVDAELGDRLHAVVVEHARINAGTAAVLSVGPPGDRESARGQPHDLSLGLRASSRAVDTELCAHLVVVGIEALPVDSRPAAVGARVLPHDHVTAIAQSSNGRLLLVAGHGGVDHLFRPDLRCAVDFWRDVDGHAARLAGAAITIGQANRQGAAGNRVRRRIGVSQRLDHLLDRFSAGAGIELHRQPGAVDTVAGDRADRHAAVADGVTGNTHLASGIAFMA